MNLQYFLAQKKISYYAQFANLTCYFPFQNGGLCDKSEYRICREYFVLGVWQEARLFSTKYIMDKQHPWPWHAAERWIWLFLCSCMAWRNNSWARIWVFKLLWRMQTISMNYALYSISMLRPTQGQRWSQVQTVPLYVGAHVHLNLLTYHASYGPIK